MKFRKLPLEVEARQFERDSTGPYSQALAAWCGGKYALDALGCRWIDIQTLEGAMRAELDDWIIKGVKGEFYPIKDSIFRETYEAAE
jgi:hypothetical protein